VLVFVSDFALEVFVDFVGLVVTFV